MDGGDTKPTKRKPARSASRGVTMEAVGRMAGVSQVTVSRALSDPSKVSAATLRKINEAIAATGFVPNAIAGALASSRSKLITALVPSITNIVYAAMIRAFSQRMREAGYQILLSETGFDPAEEERTIATHLSRRPDAILLTGIHHSPQARRMLLASGIPVVEVWDFTDSPIDICIGFRHVETGRAAAEFAVERGDTAAATISAGDERARRRKAAFSEHFTRLTGTPVAEIDFDEMATVARGRKGMARLIDDHGFTSGIVFCSSDVLAHGAIIEATKRGFAIPGDIAVIGFGDQEFAGDVEPPITTIKVDLEAFGRTAADALLRRFEGSSTPDTAIDLGFEIIRRQSA
ncbi:LacI family DNA-binding transcriptional regulator [Marinibacterium profundimaris]|uniref:LacI family transcriptional regulator n=1 Tax=Marinibacterium profundimaris TaxID=1679460 RepID=A0A225NF65_9RHOB|nr:LacI family DNA-binding transcriptional regulator [Marinibacterium profundimaris]OWU71604.1 LacI family transcriptional regulator [Marinibacterium profundimaris]